MIEREFAEFVQNAIDVTSYVKVPEKYFGDFQPSQLADVSLTFGGTATIGDGSQA